MKNMIKSRTILLILAILTFLISCGAKKNENVLRVGMECGYYQ